MSARLNDIALDQVFRTARTRNGWSAEPVPDSLLRELYDLAKWGPTAANSNPARIVFVTSTEAKEKLASVSMGANQAKIKQAPATAIIGYDLDFPQTLPKLFPPAPSMRDTFTDPVMTETVAFRNASLQGAYFLVAARALGLDCGPMSGFDNGKVDALFFAGKRVKSNFLCSVGYGTEENLFPRLPRHSFDEACKII